MWEFGSTQIGCYVETLDRRGEGSNYILNGYSVYWRSNRLQTGKWEQVGHEALLFAMVRSMVA